MYKVIKGLHFLIVLALVSPLLAGSCCSSQSTQCAKGECTTKKSACHHEKKKGDGCHAKKSACRHEKKKGDGCPVKEDDYQHGEQKGGYTAKEDYDIKKYTFLKEKRAKEMAEKVSTELGLDEVQSKKVLDLYLGSSKEVLATLQTSQDKMLAILAKEREKITSLKKAEHEKIEAIMTKTHESVKQVVGQKKQEKFNTLLENHYYGEKG